MSAGKADVDEEERRKIHHKLHRLIDKYEEMAKRMRVSSSIDYLLISTDLPYSAEVMAALLPQGPS